MFLPVLILLTTESAGRTVGPASELHTRVNGDVVYKIWDLLNGRLVGLGWDHHFVGFGFESFAGFVSFFGLITGACLRPIMTMDANFAVLPFFLVIVSSLRVGVSVTGPRVCWGSVGE